MEQQIQSYGVDDGSIKYFYINYVKHSCLASIALLKDRL